MCAIALAERKVHRKDASQLELHHAAMDHVENVSLTLTK